MANNHDSNSNTSHPPTQLFNERLPSGRDIKEATKFTHISLTLEGSDSDGESLLLEQLSEQLREPPMYQVVLLNDDYTPMEFVILVLKQFFGMETERATQVMMQVHQTGAGICGVFTGEIAETKVYLVNQFSKESQHPLMCTMEQVEQ